MLPKGAAQARQARRPQRGTGGNTADRGRNRHREVDARRRGSLGTGALYLNQTKPKLGGGAF